MSATIWGVSSCFFVVESIEEHQLDSHRVEWFAVCILLNDFSIVDHVDGFYLFSDRVIILEHFDLRVGLELNTNKTKAFNPTSHNRHSVCINGQNIKGLGQFLYIGSVVCAMWLDVSIALN